MTNHEARHDGDVKPLLATICRPHVLTRDAWQLCSGPHDCTVVLFPEFRYSTKVHVDDVNAHVKGCINEVQERHKHIRAKLQDEVRLLQPKSGAKKVRSICFYPTCFWCAGFK